MELVFYNKNRRPVAYVGDSAIIYLYSGEPVAYLHRDSIYTFAGPHVGWFIRGYVWDHAGCAVFFTSLASGPPARPVGLAPMPKGVQRSSPFRQPRTPGPAYPAL